MKIFKFNEINFEVAVDYLNKPTIIIYQTDTVYGFLWKQTITKFEQEITSIKERNQKKKFVILYESTEKVKENFIINQVENKLINYFWPGKLTIILKSMNNKEIAVRVPSNSNLRKIIKKTGPLSSTSCNKSGTKPLKKAKKIIKIFKDYQDIVLIKARKESDQRKSKASTIIKVKNNQLQVIRQGKIKGGAITNIINDQGNNACTS